MTTDHGRGPDVKDWRNHGAKVEGARGCVDGVRVAVHVAAREWRDHAPLHTNQAAATLAGWMGVDWNALRPAGGEAGR